MPRDAIELEVFKNLFHSIAEEMGAALRRTAFSPNIKERRDYSCAVFDAAGQVIAMGDHMPVHLGSMPMSVLAALDDLRFEPGDVAMLNDPFRGGTHLPDITLVAPVFIRGARTSKERNRGRRQPPSFFVASRAHHADVGGMYAGSMGICREIYQEGIRIPPVKLLRRGRFDRDVLALVLSNVRTPREREGDLGAQVAACHTGAERLRELCSRYGLARVERASADLLDYSEELMRTFLADVPRGSYASEDFLDDDGVAALEGESAAAVKPIRIAVSITFQPPRRNAPFVEVDFAGSDPQVAGSVNAVEAITYSACFYVFRCLLAEDVPATAGLMRPVRVIAPSGTIVNATPPAAVAGGNVECSQRIVDVLLRALAQAMPGRIPAAASGTMNNLTLGGMDQRSPGERGVSAGPRERNARAKQRSVAEPLRHEPFAYYETIAGGMGARPTKDGVSGIHCHMTNSWNTPAEALEYAYPFRITRYSLRPGSGGAGKFRGGDGIVREIEVLTESQVTLLADRRLRGPYGLQGGEAGAPGSAAIMRLDGSEQTLPGKASTRLRPGERIRIESPGGGGWGKASA